MTAEGRSPILRAEPQDEAADELPDGWIWANLGEFVESLRNGIYKPADFYGSGVPCLRMYNIEDGKIIWRDIKLMRLSDEEIKQYKLLPGDILINRVNSRELVGKAAVIPERLGPLVFESKNIRMRLLPESLLPKYCSYFFLTRIARDQIESEAKQTVGMATINQSQIEAWQIPVAPLIEQHRIVAKIEALFAQSHRGREALDAVPNLLAQFRQAVLAAAFRGDLTERDPTDESASVLLERIRAERRRKWEEDLRAQGKDPSRRKYEEPAPPDTSDLPELPESWAWTTVEAVTQNHDSKRIPVKEADRKKMQGPYPYYGASGVIDYVNDFLFEGDYLLIAEDGANLLSRSSPIAFQAHGQFWVNNHAHVLTTWGNIPLAYLEHLFNLTDLSPYVTGTAQPKMTQKNMNRIPIPLASLAEQRRIVARIEALFAQADILEAQVAAVRRRLEQVDQAILARAFRGDLVPQDPDDEPASVLLERIRKEREAQAAKKQTRKGRSSTKKVQQPKLL